jgi:V/A-type H+-transporting ATPase subunit E
MLLEVARGWKGDSASKVTLSALLPAVQKEAFAREFESAAGELLREGIEVGWSDKVRSGFKVGEKDGGYYIGFSDADFDALLGEFLKERVYDMLYK